MWRDGAKLVEFDWSRLFHSVADCWISDRPVGSVRNLTRLDSASSYVELLPAELWYLVLRSYAEGSTESQRKRLHYSRHALELLDREVIVPRKRKRKAE